MGAVGFRTVGHETGVDSPRYSTLCARPANLHDAHVRAELQVGMPQRVAPYSRSFTATMRVPGPSKSLPVLPCTQSTT